MSKVSRANFCKAYTGTAMIEFAIILPILLLILFGITELGRALYQQNMLTQAVELGGRYMARVDGSVNADCTHSGDSADKWTAAVIRAKNLIICGVDAGCGGETTILPNITSDDIFFEVNVGGESPVSACVITVRATANFQSIFGGDLISVPGYRLEGVTLNAVTHERYIGH